MAMHQLVETQRQPRSVLQEWAPMDREQWGHFAEIAKSMALCSTIPDHLQVTNTDGTVNFERTAANCMQIVTKAAQWRIHPFDLAQASYVQRGRIGYEGKLIQALIERDVGNLDVEYEGSGDKLVATITGNRPGDGKVVSVIGTYADWASKTKEGNITHQWRGGDYSRKMMMRYRGAREWARAHHPGLLLSVLSADELDAMHEDYRARTAVVIPSAPAMGAPPQELKMPPRAPDAPPPADNIPEHFNIPEELDEESTDVLAPSVDDFGIEVNAWIELIGRVKHHDELMSFYERVIAPYLREHVERMPKELVDKAREAFAKRKEYLLKRRDEAPE